MQNSRILSAGLAALISLSCNPPEPQPSAAVTLPATVRFARPVRETVLRTQLLTGQIVDSPADESTVSAPALGRITDLVALGTRTEPGDIVAIVEPPVLRSPASEDRRNSLAAKVGRLRQLETEGLVAREELKSAEAELQHLDALHADSGVTYELRADRRGEVVELLRPVGAEVDVGTEVLRVRGVGSLEVTARVAEPLVADLEEGLAATITVATRPGRTWTASIARLTVEPGGGRERGVDIVFRLDGDLSKLTTGLTAIIEIALGKTHEALTVPRSAIVVSDGQLAVVVRTADGTRVVPVVTREITTYGTREITVRGTSVEVLEGLNDDAEVAVEGAALLVSPASSADRSWLVVPKGRGGRLAALVGDSLRFSGPGPVRVQLNARRMATNAMSLQTVLGSLRNDTPAPADEFRIADRAALEAILWLRDRPQLQVDALPVDHRAVGNNTGALANAARKADPGVAWIGHDASALLVSPVVLAAGGLLLLLGTGSIRATVISFGAAIALFRWSGDLSPLLASAGVAPAVALLAVLRAGQLGDDEKLDQVRALTAATLSALAVLTPPALLALTRTRAIDSLAPFLAALAISGIAALILAASLRLVPTGGSFGAAPIEKLSVGPLLLVLGLGAVVTASLTPPRSTTSIIAVGGEDRLGDDELVTGLDHVVAVAMQQGAERILAARDETGQLHLAVSGPGSDRILERVRRGVQSSAPGLALGRLPETGAGLHHPRFTPQLVDDETALVAASLAGGIARYGRFLLNFVDQSDGELLPLATTTGELLYASEWRRGIVHRADRDEPVLNNDLDAAELPWYIALLTLATSASVLPAIIRERLRGARGHFAWDHARAEVTRAAAAGTGGALVTAAAVPVATIIVAAATAWGLALVFATLLVYSKKSSLIQS